MSMEQDISLALQRRAFEMQFEELWRSYSKMEEEVRNLRTENKRLKSAQYKSEELAAMQTKLDEMHTELHRGFPVNKEESRKANEWIAEHKKHCKHPSFTYQFGDTEIGRIGTVECDRCKKYCIFQTR